MQSTSVSLEVEICISVMEKPSSSAPQESLGPLLGLTVPVMHLFWKVRLVRASRLPKLLEHWKPEKSKPP